MATRLPLLLMGSSWWGSVEVVEAPEKRAVLTNWRSRMLRAIERIWRAGQGQLKSIKIMLIRSKEARPCSSDDIKMRIGKEGTTMKTSAKRVMTRSGMPPRKPAPNPAKTPISVAKKATNKPMKSEFCVAYDKSQKVSCPKLVVPSRCSALGGRLRLCRIQSRGSSGEKKGKMPPRMMKTARMIMPTVKRGFDRRIASAA